MSFLLACACHQPSISYVSTKPSGEGERGSAEDVGRLLQPRRVPLAARRGAASDRKRHRPPLAASTAGSQQGGGPPATPSSNGPLTVPSGAHPRRYRKAIRDPSVPMIRRWQAKNCLSALPYLRQRRCTVTVRLHGHDIPVMTRANICHLSSGTNRPRGASLSTSLVEATIVWEALAMPT